MNNPAFATVAGDHPRAQAEACDAEHRAGRLRGPLCGIDVAGMSVSCGTDRHDSAPAARAAGAIVPDKTDTHEPPATKPTATRAIPGIQRAPWAPRAAVRRPCRNADAAIADLAASMESVLGRDANGRPPAGQYATCAHCSAT
ncbi:MAG: hypothetical protein J4G15_13065 [Alphaproteobacteria bacterium]|nr:hypothetical protein [Alphaproteobacteria bacterium]